MLRPAVRICGVWLLTSVSGFEKSLLGSYEDTMYFHEDPTRSPCLGSPT